MSCSRSKEMTRPSRRRSRFMARMSSTLRSASSGSTLSGNNPESPSMTALSAPWPRPVQASEPNKVVISRFSAAHCSASSAEIKAAAAFIGPTVWEADGPIPILNSSNTLTMAEKAALPSLLCFGSLLALQSWDDFLCDRLDLIHSVFVGHEDDLLDADGDVRLELLDAFADRAHDRAVARAIAVLGEVPFLIEPFHHFFAHGGLRRADHDRQLRSVEQLVGILAALLGEVAQLRPGFRERFRRVEISQPAVAAGRGTLQHAIDIAADQDRHARLLHRLRIHHGGGNIVSDIISAHHRLGPHAVENFEVIVHQ